MTAGYCLAAAIFTQRALRFSFLYGGFVVPG